MLSHISANQNSKMKKFWDLNDQFFSPGPMKRGIYES